MQVKVHILLKAAMMLLPLAGLAQEKVCIGTRALYKATGRVGSTFEYDVPANGATLLSDRPDSVVVQWGTATGIFPLGVRELPTHGCIGDWAYIQVKVVGASIRFDHDEYQLCDDSLQIVFNTEDFQPAYTWSDSTIRNNYVSQPGTYELKAFDLDGCLISKSVTVLPGPRVNLGNDTVICEPGYRLLANGKGTNTAGVNPSNVDFKWSNGSSDTYIYVDPAEDEQSLWVTASAGGCVASDTVKILTCVKEEEPKLELDIPNTITPNGDGDNDTWKIVALKPFSNATVEVFDRWNRRVHLSSRGYPVEWDGRDMDGKQLPLETYYYVIRLNDGIHKQPFTGTITIVK